MIGWVDRFEVCYCRTHIYTLGSWGGRWWTFFCCVLCCTTAVPSTMIRPAVVQGRSPAVARPSPPPSGGLWPPSSLARRSSCLQQQRLKLGASRISENIKCKPVVDVVGVLACRFFTHSGLVWGFGGAPP